MLMSLPAFIQSVEEALWDAGQVRLGADERTGGAFFDGRGGHILLLMNYPAASCGVSKIARNEASFGEFTPRD